MSNATDVVSYGHRIVRAGAVMIEWLLFFSCSAGVPPVSFFHLVGISSISSPYRQYGFHGRVPLG